MTFKSGGSGDDTLFGGTGMDTLQGYAGNDHLDGGGGNDVLVGGIGGDELLGGTGNDLLFAERALPGSGGSNLVKPAGFWNSSLAMAAGVDGAFNLAPDAEIDNATTRPHVSVDATGDGSVDYYAFTVTAAGSQAVFDVDHAYPGFDSYLQLVDASGNVLAHNDDGSVDPGSQVYFSSGGSSFSRDSFLTYTFAAAGTYVVEVGSNDNATPLAGLPKPVPAGAGYVLHISLDDGTGPGAQGPDILRGGSGSDTLIGGVGNDSLFGGAGADNLNGHGGADSLYGGSGGDTLYGASGNDLQWGGPDNDRLAGGAGNDMLHGGSGTDTLIGNLGNDSLWGGLDGDHLSGNSGADRLHGGDGADRLFGGSGADSLFGGEGKDTMTGGPGSDVFVFLKATDSPTGTGRDRITDFSPGSDHMNLSAIDADPAHAGDDAFTFIYEAHFTHQAGELRYHHTSYATIVAGDIDGDGHADFQIALVGNLTLTPGDFVL